MADPDEMRMQALIIRERILGPAHPDTSYYIRYRGAVYADAGKFNRCIELWNYALDMQQKMLERLNPMTQSSLFSFTELFSFMMGKDGKATSRGRVVPAVEVEEILKVFDKAVAEVYIGNQMLKISPSGDRDTTYLTRTIVITLHLACLLTRFLSNLCDSEEMSEKIHMAIYNLVKLKINSRLGRSVLHLCCCKESVLVGRYPACHFPSPYLAEVLLKVGADPNARDEDGNTPLHLAAMAKPCPPTLIKILLENGAHFDLVNKNYETFSCLIKRQHPLETLNVIKYTKLSCLSARIIRQFKIPYKGIISPSLEQFVGNH